jgi:hypothetical protein
MFAALIGVVYSIFLIFAALVIGAWLVFGV